MSRACFSPAAVHDLNAIVHHVSARNPDAALRVRNAILDVAELLGRVPELGRKVRGAAARHAQIRWFVVPRYRNYVIFYQPVETGVLVIRVLHAAQDWTRFFPPRRA